MLRNGDLRPIVPQADPTALAMAVAGLLEDPGRALSMGRSARQEVEHYAWPLVSQEWAKSIRGESGKEHDIIILGLGAVAKTLLRADGGSRALDLADTFEGKPLGHSEPILAVRAAPDRSLYSL